MRKWFDLLTLHKEDLAKLITFECVSTEPTVSSDRWSRDPLGGLEGKREEPVERLTAPDLYAMCVQGGSLTLAGVQAQPETPVCSFRKRSEGLGLKCWHIKVQRCSRVVVKPKFSVLGRCRDVTEVRVRVTRQHVIPLYTSRAPP